MTAKDQAERVRRQMEEEYRTSMEKMLARIKMEVEGSFKHNGLLLSERVSCMRTLADEIPCAIVESLEDYFLK